MNPPIISVVMSVYNGQAFLAEAVESILNQTFRDFEFILIDDGSTDRTAGILATYASRDPRLRILRHENKGRAESLNVGIGLAQGKYIARMDADDVALPYRFQDQVDFLDRRPDVDLLGGAVEIIEHHGRVLRVVRPPSEDAEIKSLLLQYNPIYHPSVLMRKDAVLAVSGYRKPFAESEDYDLWLRMGERGRLANLEDVVLQYRVHSSQVSIQNMRYQTLCVLAARAAAEQRKRGNPDPLSGVAVVTPKLLENLGVTRAEIEHALVGVFSYWMETIEPCDTESVLQIIDGLRQSPDSGGPHRSLIANAWLRAAGLHYRQGRPGRALVSAGRAVWTRPIIAGRPVKRLITRLAAALKSR